MTMTMTTTTTTTMTVKTTMTKRAKSRSRQGAADKVWAVGLAGATCLSLVGVVGVRAAQDAAAEPVDQDAELVLSTTAGASPGAPVVGLTGLTEAQLDQYAKALEVERQRLEEYHGQLLDTAERLQESADAIAQSQNVLPAGATTKADTQGESSETGPKQAEPKETTPKLSAPKPAAKPVPKPAAAPQVVTPQAQTRGS